VGSTAAASAVFHAIVPLRGMAVRESSVREFTVKRGAKMAATSTVTGTEREALSPIP
tara:strand:+ start:241 stop:411 length:171 start_codon:yes stop_codon:yes gene_type:complete